LRAAVRPRLLVVLIVLLGMAALCARLGVWQLDRAEQRGAQVERRQVAAQEAAAPGPLGDVLAPQESFGGNLVGEHVRVRGRYEPAGQLLVADRVLDGRVGYLVLTPLRVSDAGGRAGWTGADPVLPVVRGWVASPADARALLTVPDGEVTVTGHLQSSEASGSADSPPGQTDAVSSAQLVNTWGGPIYSGYLVLAQSQPAQPAGLALLGPPTLGGGEGGNWNVQNLAYAFQWWIFAGFALFLWLRMVRDEAAGDGIAEPATEPAVADKPQQRPSVDVL
jgi:cytochrome oxidase assembly protein ShyY1